MILTWLSKILYCYIYIIQIQKYRSVSLDKDSLLKSIAIKGYDVGFGAKKHFATFDLVCKVPNVIALGTIIKSIIHFGFDNPIFINMVLSLFLIFIVIIAIFINQYGNRKNEYIEIGVKINKIYQELRNLYFKVQGTDSVNKEKIEELEQVYNGLIHQFHDIGITQQIIFSDWYAHYKFFVQLEIEWIEEQKVFTFKDKVPMSFRLTMYISIIAILVIIGCLIIK